MAGYPKTPWTSTRSCSAPGWAVAGIIGAGAQVLGGVVETVDRVGPGEPGYQLRTTVIGLAYLLLIGTVVALRRASPAGQSRAGRIALVLIGAGWFLSFVAQVVLNVRFDVAEQILFPASTTLIGLGTVVVGMTIVRSGVWRGWQRWVALVCGAFVFVVLFPAFALTGGPNFLVLTLWGGCWLALGIAALRPGMR